MKKTNYSIQIDNPCAENWNEMTKTDKGKFCAMCEKNVIDFSKLTDNEILKIIESNTNSNKNLCGRFTQTQLNRVLVNTNPQTSPKLYQFLAGLLLFSSATTANAENQKPKIENFGNETKNPIILENDTIPKNKKHNDFTITGKIIDVGKEVIPGASIVLKGNTQVATVSNDNGGFNLDLSNYILEYPIILMISAHTFEDTTLIVYEKDLESKKVFLVEMKAEDDLGIVPFTMGAIKREKTEGLTPRIANIHITQITSIREIDFTITGKITDVKKEAIPGASIVLKGNKQVATVSDDNGEFSLNISEEMFKDSLIVDVSAFSFEEITFIISKKDAESKKVFFVEMKDEQGLLGEVWVIKKRKWWQFWKRRR